MTQESEHIRATQQGDAKSFNYLVDLYYKEIYRFTYGRIWNHHDADEICQDTFVTAFTQIQTLRNPHAFRAWLYQITLNRIKQHLRHHKALSRTYEKPGQASFPELADTVDCQPPERLAFQERARTLVQILQEMPEALRDVTLLVILEGIPQKEAAQILRRSEPTLSRYVERAKAWLQAKLVDYFA